MADANAPQFPPATVGADYSATIQLQQGGANIDLTSIVAAQFYVKAAFGGSPVLQASLANSQLTLGGVTGLVTVVFPNGQLQSVAAGQYIWELELTDNSVPPIISKPVGGQFIVNDTLFQ